MQALFASGFKKDYKKSTLKIREQADARLVLFLKDPFCSLLGNHPLHGKWQGYRSINIGGDQRAIYREIAQGVAYFVALGTHGRLYR